MNIKKIILLGTAITLTACTPKEEMSIINDTITLEYGSSISTDISDYLDNTEEYIEEVVAVYPQNETDKEYPAVGEYEIKLTKDNEEGIVKVVVKDTVSPEFTSIEDKYEVKYGKSFDSKKIEAEDLSEVKITVNDENVDYKKAGDYEVKATAEDEHGNIIEKIITIKVKEEEKKTTVSSASTNKNTTGTSSSAASNNTNITTSNSSNNTSNETEHKENNQTEGQTWEIVVPEVDMATHVHQGPAVAGMYFDDPDELDEWACDYRIEQCESGNYIGGAYGVTQCLCGKYFVHRFY